MAHLLSTEDREFRAQFESGEFPIAEFDHRAHVRLAYVYLAEHDTEAAHRKVREALRGFLESNGVDGSKYHETMTRAWIMAVRHFMRMTSGTTSAETFIGQHPSMLDAEIMMTHYSAEVLFSDAARTEFVEPDLDPIPRYGE